MRNRFRPLVNSSLTLLFRCLASLRSSAQEAATTRLPTFATMVKLCDSAEQILNDGDIELAQIHVFQSLVRSGKESDLNAPMEEAVCVGRF